MKCLILGAGPAGLTLANRLKQKGMNDFLVLEKESEAGGLCRSRFVDGAAFDIGGGHFLDVRRPKVNRFLFSFMPEEEWNLFTRDSRIVINDNEISHPIEANIWQMQMEDQVSYLKSIAVAGCNQGKEKPEAFTEWIYWKLGDRIAEDYMIPYNRKMFGEDLDQLGTYWLEKLPNVSFEETLRSCLEKKAYGKQPGHAHFYYPKEYGYGELWRRMAESLGEHIRFETCVEMLDMETNTKKVKTTDGGIYEADTVINTIPWTAFREIRGIPKEIRESIGKLKYSAIETRYYEEELETKAQWIYYPDPELAYHRILVRGNFCAESKGYWTETNAERTSMIPAVRSDGFCYMNEYAYPLNTIEKTRIMDKLLNWCIEKNVIGLGRWGEWQHYNSDVTVEKAMLLAEGLT